MGRVSASRPNTEGLDMDEQTTEDERPPRRVTPMEAADILVMYLTRRREMLIIELREVDRLLGRPQTVPVRER